MSALQKAIEKALPSLKVLAEENKEQQPVWERDGDGWRGSYRLRTSITEVLRKADAALGEIGKPFIEPFLSEHPEYSPGQFITIPELGMGKQMEPNRTELFKRVIRHLWQKRETFECDSNEISVAANDFRQFVDLPTIQIMFQAPLAHFRMAGDVLAFNDELRIRKLSADEMSAFSGRSFNPEGLVVYEYLVEGSLATNKPKGSSPINVDMPLKADQELQKTIRCLRVFKEGVVGYQWVHYRFVGFSLFELPSYGSSERLARFGGYTLNEEEMNGLSDFARRLNSLSDSAMTTASNRLAISENRLRPEDQILDAIIGMEALLLAGLGGDDRRGELKLRFSLNYSTLFESPDERRIAYRIAKDLYDHRCTIAHGGDLKPSGLRVGTEKLTIHEVAQHARETLRSLIKNFLRRNPSVVYKDPNFWEQGYFIADTNRQLR